MLQRLWNRWRRGRRLVLVPAECPWLADPQAEPVTELPPTPAPPTGPRWPWLPAATLGVCYGSVVSFLALVVIVMLNLRHARQPSK